MPTMTAPAATAADLVRHAGEGEAIDFIGVLVTVKIAGEATGDRFSLAEHWCPPGFATPLHVHHEEDEAFVILEGAIAGTCGGHPFRAEAGATVFLPRDLPHGFAVAGDQPARIMVFAAPAGFERFCREVGVPAAAGALPAPPTHSDIERLLAIAPRFDMELLPPE